MNKEVEELWLSIGKVIEEYNKDEELKTQIRIGDCYRIMSYIYLCNDLGTVNKMEIVYNCHLIGNFLDYISYLNKEN